MGKQKVGDAAVGDVAEQDAGVEAAVEDDRAPGQQDGQGERIESGHVVERQDGDGFGAIPDGVEVRVVSDANTRADFVRAVDEGAAAGLAV